VNKFLHLSLLTLPFIFSSVAYADPQASTMAEQQMSSLADSNSVNLRERIIASLADLNPGLQREPGKEGAERSLSRIALEVALSKTEEKLGKSLRHIETTANMETISAADLNEALKSLKAAKEEIGILKAKFGERTQRLIRTTEALLREAENAGGISLNLGTADFSLSGNSRSDGRTVTEETPGQTRYVEELVEEKDPLEFKKANAELNIDALGKKKQEDEDPLNIFKKNRSRADSSLEGYQQSPLAGFIMARKDELVDRVKECKISLEQSRLLSSVKKSLRGLKNGITLGILDEKEARKLFMQALNDFGSTARKFEDIGSFEAFLETADSFLENYYRSEEETSIKIIPASLTTSSSNQDIPPVPGSSDIPLPPNAPPLPGSSDIPLPPNAPPLPGSIQGIPPVPGFGSLKGGRAEKKEKIPEGVSKKAWAEMKKFYKSYGNKNDGIFPPCLWKSAEKITKNEQTKKGKVGRANSSHFKNAKKNYEKSDLLLKKFTQIRSLGASGFEKNKDEVYTIFKYFKSYMPKSRGRKELVCDVSSEKSYVQTLDKIRGMLFEMNYNLDLAKKRFKKPSSKKKKKKAAKKATKKIINMPNTIEEIDTLEKKHLEANLRAAIKACPHGFVSINQLQIDPSKIKDAMIGGINPIVSNLLAALPSSVSFDPSTFKEELLREFTRILKRNNALEESDLKSPKVFEEFALFYSNKLRKIIRDSKILDMESPVSPLNVRADGKWGELLFFAVQGRLKKEEAEKHTIQNLRSLIQGKPYKQSQPMDRIKERLRGFLKTAIQNGAEEIFSKGDVVVQRVLTGDDEVINFGNWLASPMHGEIKRAKEADKLKLKKYQIAMEKFMDDKSQSIPPEYPSFSCSESTIDLEKFAGSILIERITSRFLDSVEMLPQRSGPMKEIDLIKNFNAPNRAGVLAAIEDVIIDNKFIFPQLSGSMPQKALGSIEVEVLPEILSTFVLQKMKPVKEIEIF
jgi:hypothetical protein